MQGGDGAHARRTLRQLHRGLAIGGARLQADRLWTNCSEFFTR